MQYKMTNEFKNEWKKWEEPITTLEELQETLDMVEDAITLWVVKDISTDGILTYDEQKFESLPLNTSIDLMGVKFETPNNEFTPATAIIKVL